MRKIVIIGVLHAGLTPESELEEVLEKYGPDQLLIEIVEKDIIERKLDSYPPEMVFAYTWAKKKKVKVSGFDSKTRILKAGMTEEDNQKVVDDQKMLMKNYSWRDMNQMEYLRKLNTHSARNLIDPKKEEKRELEMVRNINTLMIKEGKILVITGCGHLIFFEKHIPSALFPFRHLNEKITVRFSLL